MTNAGRIENTVTVFCFGMLTAALIVLVTPEHPFRTPPPQPPTYCTTFDRPSGMIVPCQLGWKHWETWLKDGKDI